MLSRTSGVRQGSHRGHKSRPRHGLLPGQHRHRGVVSPCSRGAERDEVRSCSGASVAQACRPASRRRRDALGREGPALPGERQGHGERLIARSSPAGPGRRARAGSHGAARRLGDGLAGPAAGSAPPSPAGAPPTASFPQLDQVGGRCGPGARTTSARSNRLFPRWPAWRRRGRPTLCWRTTAISARPSRSAGAIDPLIAPARERHHLSWRVFAEALPAPEDRLLHRRRPRAARSTPCASRPTGRRPVMGFRQWPGGLRSRAKRGDHGLASSGCSTSAPPERSQRLSTHRRGPRSAQKQAGLIRQRCRFDFRLSSSQELVEA